METLPVKPIKVANYQIQKLIDEVREIQQRFSFASISRLSTIRKIDDVFTLLVQETNSYAFSHSIALKNLTRNLQEVVKQAKQNLRDIAFYSALGNFYRVEESTHKLQLNINILMKVITEVQKQL